MIKEAIAKLIEGQDLTMDECALVMNDIMSGQCTDAQIGAFLVTMRLKGETVEEIAAAAKVMREKATRVPASVPVIDTCGTGGDGLATFNISTAAAIVAAGGGAHIAKHGNRSVSSSSGSSQVLEALGVNIDAPVEVVAKCIEEAGIGFLFAPLLHGAMKYAIGPRKEMGVRTIFNILGPLTNPAGAKRQLLGVYTSSLVETLAHVLKTLGSECAMVVHGHDGLDEISITDETTLAQLKDGEVESLVIAPEDFDMKRAPLEAIRVASPEESAEVIRKLLAGGQGPARDIVLLNAGAALFVAGIAEDMVDGIARAAEAIDSGTAAKTLEKLVAVSNS
ncbi:MAG: anthranilate phosphoribosyltransferase [Planctomycetes bacterium]|nr:anthranilate phosphoribosyltransferase [Planctomycetota bacterium]